MLASLLCLTILAAPGQVVEQDVLLFVLDDCAAADLALYGGPVPAPNLEALAATGVRFDAAYSNPVCQATRRSLLFGHWWTTNSGENCSMDPPGAQAPGLADYCLPRRVPRPSLLAGKWHLGPSPSGGDWREAPREHGFAHWVSGMPANLPNCGGVDYTSWLRVDDGASSVAVKYEPKDLRDRAIFWWNATPAPRLFLLSPALAHAPFHAPPADLLPPGYVVGSSNRSRYEAMLVAADAILRQVLAAVDLRTTTVIVLSDNGTPPNATPEPNRSKTTTFERGVRVPLVIAGAGVACPGRVSQELVHVVDLYATVVDLCGGTLPTDSLHPIKGVSLRPTLEGVPGPHVYHETILCGTLWGTAAGDRCARSPTRKLRQLDQDDDGQPDHEELYDLVLDPGELVNRVSDPAYAYDLASLRAWIIAESQ